MGPGRFGRRPTFFDRSSVVLVKKKVGRRSQAPVSKNQP